VTNRKAEGGAKTSLVMIYPKSQDKKPLAKIFFGAIFLRSFYAA